MSSKPAVPLKIVHTEASLGWGGQEIRVLTEAAGLIERGHQVWIIAPHAAQIYARASAYGVPALALPIGRKTLRGVWALRQWLKQQAVDVINTHSSSDSWLTVLACCLLPKRQRPAIVRSRHISAPVKASRINRWLYGRAVQQVVTTGEAIRQLLIQDLGLPATQVISIPTGIDLQRFTPLPIGQEKPFSASALGFAPTSVVVGIVATLRSWKGHRYLVEALAQLNQTQPARPYALLIVGDGAGWQPLQQQIHQLGLSSQVHMAGNQADVVPYLQSMDVFCLPSYANEGVPQALLQAMACQLPIVTTPVGAIPEIIQDRVNGYSVEPRSSNALANALAALLADPTQASALAHAARQSALTHAEIGLMLTRMEQVLRAAHASRCNLNERA